MHIEYFCCLGLLWLSGSISVHLNSFAVRSSDLPRAASPTSLPPTPKQEFTLDWPQGSVHKTTRVLLQTGVEVSDVALEGGGPLDYRQPSLVSQGAWSAAGIRSKFWKPHWAGPMALISQLQEQPHAMRSFPVCLPHLAGSSLEQESYHLFSMTLGLYLVLVQEQASTQFYPIGAEGFE